MLFIEDLSSLGEEHVHLFNPRPFSGKSILGLCIYAYLREEDDEHGPANSVYYVGEGSPTRPLDSNRLVKVPPVANVVILADRLNSKNESLFGEAILIKAFGRICNGTGVLQNISPGCTRLLRDDKFVAGQRCGAQARRYSPDAEQRIWKHTGSSNVLLNIPDDIDDDDFMIVV